VNALNIAEVAPLAPAAAELLAPLGMLCILIVVYGMVLGVDAIARGFFGTVAGAVGWIPYVGGVISKPIRAIEQKIVSFLVGLEQHIDSAIGHSWHSLANVATHLWHTLERESLIAWQALKFLSGVPTLHELLHAELWLRREIKTAEVEAEHALRHAVRTEEHALSSVAHNIYPRLRTIEHEVERTIPREIKHARALAREATDAVARLWKRVSALEQSVSARAIEAAVVAVLATVGLDWIACRSRNSVNGKSGCAMWNDLDALLGLFAAGLVISDYRDLVKIAQGIEHDITVGVQDLLKV
jgi:hypothetical protein